jgi:hypothetical protein
MRANLDLPAKRNPKPTRATEAGVEPSITLNPKNPDHFRGLSFVL